MTKKILIITNLITLLILAGLVFRKIRNRFRTEEVVKVSPLKIDPTPCEYKLEYFDFHYKEEIHNPKILMLGNSLIRHGKWDSLLGRNDVSNRGISGDHLPCICERLKYLKNTSAKIIFVEGGINDFPGGNTDTLFNYYREIVNFWKEKKKIPVVNMLLYIAPKAGITFPFRKDYQSINDSVFKLNAKLLNFVNEYKLDFIDLNNSVSDTSQRLLLNDFTTDGVHLTEEGYQKWANSIKPILLKYKL